MKLKDKSFSISVSKQKTYKQSKCQLLKIGTNHKQKNKNKNKNKNRNMMSPTEQYDLFYTKELPFLKEKNILLLPKDVSKQKSENCIRSLERKFIKNTPIKKRKQQVNNKESLVPNQKRNNPAERKIRYNKFEFRSEKYSKLVEEMNSKKQLQKIGYKNDKPCSSYKKKVFKLQQDIESMRNLSSQSCKTLKKMEVIKKKEIHKFQQQKKKYLNEIKRLSQLSKQYGPQLGHIFTYRQFKNDELVPKSIIPQKKEETSHIGLGNRQKSMFELRNLGEEIMSKYLTVETNQSEDNNDNPEICLSILSNPSSQNGQVRGVINQIN